MNAGLPIITTRKGIEGVRVNDKEHVIIVDDIGKEMVESIKYLVQNRKERERLGLNARRLAEDEYSWGIIGGKVDSTYRMIEKQGARRHKTS
jgi:glycosyltransferase involved in cell wall biosynthesis